MLIVDIVVSMCAISDFDNWTASSKFRDRKPNLDFSEHFPSDRAQQNTFLLIVSRECDKKLDLFWLGLKFQI